MASSTTFLLLCTLLISSLSNAQKSFRPDALILPVVKDASSLQYVTTINQRTPQVPVRLVVDLGGRFLWVDCDQGYVSSSYRTIPCRSAQCLQAQIQIDRSICTSCNATPSPGCNNNTCGLSPENTVTGFITSGTLEEDTIAVQSTVGSHPGATATVPKFVFTCTGTHLLENLANGTRGMAGLGRTRFALPSQLASKFSFRRRFGLCLSSSTVSSGVIFFGDGPYVLLPDVDVSKSLTYTPLIINPVRRFRSANEPSYEYFIGVKSIKINGKDVPLNASLLSIDRDGVGGTKISTVNPYTILETSIYEAVTKAFIREATSMNITRVASVAPFGVCFSSKNIASTRLGPAVPTIDLVLQNKDIYWRIFGANSMIFVKDDVMCLAFVNAGPEPLNLINPNPSIIIGGHQLEDNLLQFDLAYSRLGFSSTLRSRQTTCANFNFTSNAESEGLAS